MAMNANTVTTSEVRLSYLSVFQPQTRPGSTEAKYSVTILLPKSDAAGKAALDGAIAAAIEAGLSKCWNGVRPPTPSLCIHDGDGPRPSDGQPYGEECRGMWVFTASSKNPPFVVDLGTQPILQQTEIYSGMYGRANVSFFPYNNSGKKGVGCALNGIQKIRDGEPLSGRVTAEEAFGAPVAAPAYAPPTAPAYPGYPVADQPYAYPQQPVYGGFPTAPAAPAYPQPPAYGGFPVAGM